VQLNNTYVSGISNATATQSGNVVTFKSVPGNSVIGINGSQGFSFAFRSTSFFNNSPTLKAVRYTAN
jgi:hypothetical protein